MSTSGRPRIQRSPNLTEQVTEALKLDIIGNGQAPGTQLPSEQAMAQKYGVSRTVMREAISRLKAEGLLVTRQGLGAFISAGTQTRPFRIDAIDSADAEAVLKIVELRSGFEIEATELAAQRRSRADLRELKDALDDMWRAVKAGDVAAGAAADFKFHRAIYMATGNEYFLAFFDFISQFYQESLQLSRHHSANDRGRESQAHEEHTAVYQAIHDKDIEEARVAARVLLQNTAKRIVVAPGTPMPADSPAIAAAGAATAPGRGGARRMAKDLL